MTATTPAVAAIALATLVGCKDPRRAEPAPVAVARDHDAAVLARPAIDAPTWPALARLHLVGPLRVVTLPVKLDVPRFDVAGPVLAGDIAVVASSQFGFAAIDWRQGTLRWIKPAGAHVAPPLVRAGRFVLIGTCVAAPDLPDGEQLLGCMRITTPAGVDDAYLAIHGAQLDEFAGERGAQALWLDGDHRVRWRRGDRAVTIDPTSGVATPADPTSPPLIVSYQGRRWEVSQVDGRIQARTGNRLAWATDQPYTALLGAVYLPGQPPMIRVANASAFAGEPELDVLDIDATGSMNGQAAFPVPGIGLLGHATSSIGDVALAVRLDASLEHDFVAAYAANAFQMWVYPLPAIPRADPVGLAIAPDAVVVFHDGDTVTILPDLSASQNPTP